jgi:hypothetical protein
VATAACDIFGEFLLDGLEPGSEYTVTIAATGYRALTQTLTLAESRYLGTLVLQRV